MNGNNFVYIMFMTLIMAQGFAQSTDLTTTKLIPAEDSSRVKVQRLSINSNQSDFSPVLTGNTLIFASGRPSMIAVSYTNETNTEITDLYYATKQDSVNFSKVKPFSKIINTKVNEGSCTLSGDGNNLYFSGNARLGKSRDGSADRLQIYKSTKIKNQWSIPELAQFSNPAYSNFHPTLSKDQQLIIFCSDKAGGFGGIDLYFTRADSNGWSEPINLGKKINSSANELFPFLSSTSQLYFSSNREGGLGGLDLFLFELNDSATAELTALKHPINSPFDDFGMCTDSAGNTGYFTSNRRFSSGDDIYYFSSAYPDFSNAATPPVKNKFCYSFFEENDYQSNDSISMTYEWDFGDGQKMREEKARHCFAKPGNYKVQLNIVEKNSGEVFFNQVSYDLTIEPATGLFITVEDSTQTGQELMINAERCNIKGYTLTGFYWSFGDGKYNIGNYTKHIYLNTGTFNIELGVTAKNEKTNKIEKFKVQKKIIVKATI